MKMIIFSLVCFVFLSTTLNAQNTKSVDESLSPGCGSNERYISEGRYRKGKNILPDSDAEEDALKKQTQDCVEDNNSMTGYICKGAAKPMMKGKGGVYDVQEQLQKGKK